MLFSVTTAVVSAFLDNVTTVLLLTPMLLYITRRMGVNPVPYLLAEIFASNIGGTATLIGDPPNIMIGSAAKLSFNDFIVNMAPISFMDLFIMIALVYILYKKEFSRVKYNLDGIMNLREEDAIKDRELFKNP